MRVAAKISVFFPFPYRDSVTRFSNLGFFHQTIPPRALIHGLKPFCIWLRFRPENRDNRLQSSDPAVSMRPRNRIPRFQWDRGNQSRGLNEIAETDDKNFQFYLRIFSCSLPEPHNFSCRIPRSQWDRGIGIGSRGHNETAESDAAVSMRPPFCIWLRIRRENRFGNRQNWIPRSQWDRGNRNFLSEFPFNIDVF
jgi:hypothetical protein